MEARAKHRGVGEVVKSTRELLNCVAYGDQNKVPLLTLGHLEVE